MSDTDQTPELINGFTGWLAHNPNYRGLWRFMCSPGSIHTVDDLKQQLWLAWLETSAAELTGNFVTDARNRGFFEVLNRVDYWFRVLRLRGLPIDAKAPDGKAWAEGMPDERRSGHTRFRSPQKSGAKTEHKTAEHCVITRRGVVRRLASVKTSRDFEALDIMAPSNTATSGEHAPTYLEHITVSRRNWSRLMNS